MSVADLQNLVAAAQQLRASSHEQLNAEKMHALPTAAQDAAVALAKEQAALTDEATELLAELSAELRAASETPPRAASQEVESTGLDAQVIQLAVMQNAASMVSTSSSDDDNEYHSHSGARSSASSISGSGEGGAAGGSDAETCKQTHAPGDSALSHLSSLADTSRLLQAALQQHSSLMQLVAGLDDSD